MRVIGVKCSLQKSIIQIERKMRGYRGKKQFTAIIHSKKSPKHGIQINSPQSFIQNNCKMLDYRGKMQFTTIIHSKKAQNTG
jgi:hypothetical protein